MGAADDVADGVQKVGLAQAGLAVDKERVIVFGRMVGDRDRGGVGELVGRTDNKVLEGVFLVGGQADGFAGLDGCGRLVAVDDSDRDRFAEQLGQRLLQGGGEARFDDLFLKLVGSAQDKAGPLGETASASSNQAESVTWLKEPSMRDNAILSKSLLLFKNISS